MPLRDGSRDEVRRPDGDARSEKATVVSDYAPKPAEPRRLVSVFYSFKGGVGRSQALCAVAHLLLQQRRRVLLVDIDLEAPGLSLALLDAEVLRSRPGFLEVASDLARMLLNALKRGVRLPENMAEHVAQRIAGCLHEVVPAQQAVEPDLLARLRSDFPQLRVPERVGGLYLLSCGRVYENYAAGIAALRLREMLACSLAGKRRPAEQAAALVAAGGFPPDGPQPENLLQVFVRILHDAFLGCKLPVGAEGEEPEYVLVDSRAGLADIGGLCVRGLADHLVMLSGLNRQNLAGSAMVLDLLDEVRRARDRLTVALSPVPDADVELLDQRIQEAQRKLKLDSAPLLLHYQPRLALIEECFVGSVHRHSQLAADYRRLALRIQRAHNDTWFHHASVGLMALHPALSREQAKRALDHLIEAALLSPDEAADAVAPLCGYAEHAGLASDLALDLFRLRAALRPNDVASWGVLAQRLSAAATRALDQADRQAGHAAFEEAFTRYDHALRLEDDPSRTDISWGNDLGGYAQRLWDAGDHPGAAARYEDAFQHYAQALQAKPDMHEAMNNWGNDLAGYAQRLWDAGDREGSAARFEQAFERYAQALQAKPDKHEAMENWGGALINYAQRLSIAGEADEARARYDEGREKLLAAERIQPGSGAYNLACLEALLGRPETALAHLEQAIRRRPELAGDARKDPDLRSLQSNPRFRELTGLSG